MSPASDRRRIDQLLVDRGLAPNRTRAQALILAGRVFHGEERVDKPGARFRADVELEVRGGRRHVGRGAWKLAGALDAWPVDPAGRDALDVGASTGGFTEILLERGVRRVIALDVGHGQLDWGLRNRPEVHVVEGCNARYLVPDQLPWVPDIAVIDVSFISLDKILPAIVPCLADGADVLALVKPQFEVGRGHVGRGGIVRDPGLHRDVLQRIVDLARISGWGPRDVRPSSIAGAEGNREFFLWLRPGSPAAVPEDAIEKALAARVTGGPEEAG